MNNYIYHGTDVLKHKAAILNAYAFHLQNYQIERCSFMNFLLGETMSVPDSEVILRIMNNTSMVPSKRAVLRKILNRANSHDNSKLKMCEFIRYSEITPLFAGLEYGTPEHRAVAYKLDSVFKKYHVPSNPHHPEYYPDGVLGMNMYDFMEMIIDWCAAARCRGFKFKMSTIDAKAKSLGLDKNAVEIIKLNIPLILEPEWILEDSE